MDGTKRKFVVFYSWQSDLSNASNRSLIQDALERAAKRIRDDDSIVVDLVIDRDTQGVAGAPDIASTIFSKIDTADAVIADVSIVTPADASRPSPNPNVLLELGYSIRSKGWERVALVLNRSFGGPELLPFDLRGRRALIYNSDVNDSNRAEPRKLLEAQIEQALRSFLAHAAPEVGDVIAPPTLKQKALDGIRQEKKSRASDARRFAEYIVQELISIAPNLAKAELDQVALMNALDTSRSFVDDFTEVALVASEFSDEFVLFELYAALERIAECYWLPRGVGGSYWDHQFEYFSMVGYELMLVLTASILRDGRLNILGNLLRRRLRITNHPNGEPHVSFSYLAPRSWITVSRESAPGGGRFRSPLGQYFRRRYGARTRTDTTLVLSDVEAADMFLFLRASLPPNGNPHQPAWHAHVAVVANEVPRFLTNAETVEEAKNLAAALGQPSVEVLKKAIGDYGWKLLTTGFTEGSLLGAVLRDYNVERLASLP